MRVLHRFWCTHSKKNVCTRDKIEKKRSTVDRMSLYVFFSVFPVREQGYTRTVQKYCAEKGEEWDSMSYYELRMTLPYYLTKYITAKNYTKLLSEYIDDIVEMKMIVKCSEDTEEYEVGHSSDKSSTTEQSNTHTNSAKEYTDDAKHMYIDADVRRALIQSMCETVQHRIDTDATWSDARTKHIALGVATDNIRRAQIPYSARTELLSIMKKKLAHKRSYTMYYTNIATMIHGQSISVCRCVYTTVEIAHIVYDVKTHILAHSKIDMLTTHLHYDYFVLEHVIVCLEMMNVVKLPISCIRANNICIMPVRVREEYTRAMHDRMAYTDIFFIPDVFTHYSVDSTDVMYCNAYCIFRHLIHRGTCTISTVVKYVPFLCIFEVLDACNAYPSVFRLYHHASNECIVMLHNNVYMNGIEK